MSQRRYGLRATKPPASDTGPARSDAWSGRGIIAAVVLVLLLLGVLIYGVNKTITHADNTTASAPRTTGQAGSEAGQ